VSLGGRSGLFLGGGRDPGGQSPRPLFSPGAVGLSTHHLPCLLLYRCPLSNYYMMALPVAWGGRSLGGLEVGYHHTPPAHHPAAEFFPTPHSLPACP